jgi:hypothetical protein
MPEGFWQWNGLFLGARRIMVVEWLVLDARKIMVVEWLVLDVRKILAVEWLVLDARKIMAVEWLVFGCQEDSGRGLEISSFFAMGKAHFQHNQGYFQMHPIPYLVHYFRPSALLLTRE